MDKIITDLINLADSDDGEIDLKIKGTCHGKKIKFNVCTQSDASNYSFIEIYDDINGNHKSIVLFEDNKMCICSVCNNILFPGDKLFSSTDFNICGRCKDRGIKNCDVIWLSQVFHAFHLEIKYDEDDDTMKQYFKNCLEKHGHKCINKNGKLWCKKKRCDF